MPFYCYTVEYDGVKETHERMFTMQGVRESIMVHCKDGKHRKAERDFAAETGGRRRTIAEYPVISTAMGCDPDQIPSQIREFKSKGINVDFTPDGDMIVPDWSTHKKVTRELGLGYR